MMIAPPEFLRSGKRRSKLEIYVDVLRIIERGVNKPTRIMYAANLSWRAFGEIITNLEKNRLIECKKVKDCTRIFITEKGKRVLRNLETILTELVLLNAAPSMRPKRLADKNKYGCFHPARQESHI